MDMTSRRFVASYSGGKDSILALHRAIRQGMVPDALIITYNTDMDRSWFHGIPERVLEDVSRSLQIPIRLVRTPGKAYAENFRQTLLGLKKNGAEVCVFGDIDIEGHLEWGAKICREAGIEAYFPLWQQPREKLVREFISSGYKAHITVVDTQRLSSRHLGMVLSEETVRSISSEGADACGENGEYHTFVSDGPLFTHPVNVVFGEKIVQDHYEILPLIR